MYQCIECSTCHLQKQANTLTPHLVYRAFPHTSLFSLLIGLFFFPLRYAGRARDIKNVPHRVLEEGAGAGGAGSGAGRGGSGSVGNGTSLRGTVDEIELLRTKLVETTAVRDLFVEIEKNVWQRGNMLH